VLREDGKLIPVTHFDSARHISQQEAAAKSKDYVRLHWKYHDDSEGSPSNGSAQGFEALLDRIRSYSLCISGMAFQDVWNIDLERLRRCCIHVVTQGQKLIPFCAYYLTDAGGRRFVDMAFKR
jgi:hypothetical protein